MSLASTSHQYVPVLIQCTWLFRVTVLSVLRQSSVSVFLVFSHAVPKPVTKFHTKSTTAVALSRVVSEVSWPFIPSNIGSLASRRLGTRFQRRFLEASRLLHIRRLLLGASTTKECCLSGTLHSGVCTVAVFLRSVFQKSIFLDEELDLWNKSGPRFRTLFLALCLPLNGFWRLARFVDGTAYPVLFSISCIFENFSRSTVSMRSVSSTPPEMNSFCDLFSGATEAP